MNASTLLGTARTEYHMQVSRWTLWAVPAAAEALLLATGSFAFQPGRDPASVSKMIGDQAVSMNLIVLVIVGALLADRWVRDRHLGVEELLHSLPASAPTRLWGKYLGVAAASATPLLVVWAVLTARVVIHFGSARAAATAAGAYLAIVLPGLAFVAAFSIVCPRVTGVRVYQVLFVGYWFWGNLVPQRTMPTLSGTWLTPIGKYANAGLFSHASHSLLLTGGGSPGTGYASIALLACITIGLLAGASLHEYRRPR
ncbi:MAG: hypothetical protein ACRDNF_26920 [Streptosporangiaceae bacterium]